MQIFSEDFRKKYFFFKKSCVIKKKVVPLHAEFVNDVYFYSMNMKKFVLLSLILLGTSTLIVAQETAANNGKDTTGIHPWNVAENAKHVMNDEDANWLLFLHGGFNVFNGDFNVDQGKEAKHCVFAPSVGLGAEYKFNPTWGLGVDYTFRQVGVTGNTSITDADGKPINMSNLLKGFQHEASVYLTFDLFNLFMPNAKTKLFALNLIAGGSFLAYRNTHQTPVGYTMKVDGIKVKVPDFWKNKTGTESYQQAYPDGSDTRKMDKYNYVGGFIGGASFDFNVSRDIALGIRALYHFYGNDKVDGRTDVGTNNDGVFDTELLLRWKIQAQKKSHVSNYVNKAQIAHVAKDTVVVMQRDTVIMQVAKGDTTTNIYNTNSAATYISNPESEKENYYYVYFPTDRSDLSDEALVVVQQVADRLQENPDLYVAVIGYCDNVGTANYNKRLGSDRAQNVMEELQMEHGIDAERMFAISKGIVVGRRSSSQYAPNRRVEIRLVNRSFYDNLRVQYREDIEWQKNYLEQKASEK